MGDSLYMYNGFKNLGFFPPYVYDGSHFRSFRQVSSYVKATNFTVDQTAVCEFVSKFYFLGERTILEGVRKAPWFARPAGSKWEFADLPEHGNTRLSPAQVANTLGSLLKHEVLRYLEGKRRVGLLLSGGMDSRVVAAVLSNCILEERLNVEVTAITWGMNGCRDVEYARRIARKYEWQLCHFKLSHQNLLENIEVTSDYGCEFSPLHLHAMPSISAMTGLDCILAASFGDSVGRGVYSGRHLLKLKDLLSNLKNYFQILNPEIFKSSLSNIRSDVQTYRDRFPRASIWQQCEIDRQVHYMRRQLNPCMSVINDKIPVYQVFADPKTFGFMWSLSPQVRGDQIYYELLSQIDNTLLEIPWARNGRRYWTGGKELDGLSREHNRYGLWVRSDLHDFIRDSILSDEIARLGIFNMKVLESLIRINKKLSRTETANRIDQILLWIASLAQLIRSLNIPGCGRKPSRGRHRGKIEAIAYCVLKNDKRN